MAKAKKWRMLAFHPAQRMAVTSTGRTSGRRHRSAAWHWLYFLPAVASCTGEDGHARRGGFLPPVTLPRPWAGSRIAFQRDLHVGERALKKSTIVDVTEKQGKSGSLVFVRVQRKSSVKAAAIVEEQDIVYREAPAKTHRRRPHSPRLPNHNGRAITPAQVSFATLPSPSTPPHSLRPRLLPRCEAIGLRSRTAHRKPAPRKPPERAGSTTQTFRSAPSALYDTQPFRVEGRIDGENAQL